MLLTFVALLASVVGPGQWQPAAAVSAPTGLAPASGASVAGIPVLSWNWTPGADDYEVEVSGNAFGTVAWRGNTAQRRIVPDTQLPTSALQWRVRARGAGQVSEWATASISRTAIPGPVPLSPADDETLAQPDSPVLLTWAPLAGEALTGYEINISTDERFVDPSLVTTYTTKTSSFLVPSPQVATEYFWKVTGVLGNNLRTNWSTTRSYKVSSLPPARSSMPTSPANSLGQLMQDGDMHVDWEPVPGATTYDIQFDDDADFNSLAHSDNGLTSTRYSPPRTLNHDQYYWRVRSHNSLGHRQDWPSTPTGEFERLWSDRIHLRHPIDRTQSTDLVFGNSVVVTDPFYFEWSPVKLASRYEIQMSTNKSFSAGTVSRCSTVHTTFTPSWGGDGAGNGSCMPAAGGDYYWKVVGFDEFGSPTPTTDITQGSIEVGRFTYRPGRATLTAPADGAVVSVPSLRWTPQPGISRYRVNVYSSAGGLAVQNDTAATSFTPRNVLAPGDYEWDVVTLSEDGRWGTTLLNGRRTFTVVEQPAATSSTPTIVGPGPGTYGRFPTLRWTPVAGAAYYEVWVRKAGSASGGWERVSDTFPYPAGEDDETKFLSPDTYEWYVVAKNPQNGTIGSPSPSGLFTIGAPDEVTNLRASLSGAALAAGDTCLTPVAQGCQNLRQTPLLTWDKATAAPAGYWKLYLSRNAAMTNLVGNGDGYPMTFPINVSANTFIPPYALPSGQSGVAYWWAVQPCSAANECAPLRPATHSFNIKALPVELEGPGDVMATPQAETDVVPDDITFRWSDYLQTTTTAKKGSPAGFETTLNAPATTEARQYQIQVAGDPTFNSLVYDDIQVDQTSYTSINNTYPEGVLYWRVRAFDGSSNALAWSETLKVVKASDGPAPQSPVGGTSTNGLEPLRWKPLPYAASYNIEVYRAGDINSQDANVALRVNGITQVAYSPSEPFQASDQPYVWRVQRVDARGRRGAWSAVSGSPAGWATFRVAGAAPALTTPAPQAEVAPLDNLFSWQPVTGAMQYRFERRRPGAGNLTESKVTTALAWAPNSSIERDGWEWRVTSIDGSGRDLASSPWRAFNVIPAPFVTSPVSIQGSGAVGAPLTGSGPTWNFSGVSTSYQWLRDGQPISGATGLGYQLTGEDNGRNITLRATGTLPGYAAGSSTSNGVRGTAGAAPTTTTGPNIAGSGQVGTVITASLPSWAHGNVTTTTTWLRDGVDIGGQDTRSYTVTVADVGRSITLRATGRMPHHQDAVVTSNSITGVLGSIVTASAPPVVTGVPTVGQTLSASNGTWPSGTSLTHQWLRDGAIIPGATGASYTLVPKDATRPVAVVVTGSRSGYAEGTSVSAPVQVGKMASTTLGQLSAAEIKKRDKLTFTITVSVAGLASPTGTVIVKDRRKKLKQFELKPNKNGTATLRLPKLKKGKHRIRAFYLGTLITQGSKSRSSKLVVR